MRTLGPLGAILAGWLSQRDSNAILKRYNQLSEHNNGERQAVLFLGREFGRDPATGQFRLLDARMLTREEANKLCDGGVEELQRLIDKAVKEMTPHRDQLSNSQYGTEVHSKVERKIKDSENYSNPKGFKAEVSFVKMDEESAKAVDPDNPPKYSAKGNRGDKGSIRLDVLQPVLKKRTVCVHDMKTLPTGLSPARIREFTAGYLIP